MLSELLNVVVNRSPKPEGEKVQKIVRFADKDFMTRINEMMPADKVNPQDLVFLRRERSVNYGHGKPLNFPYRLDITITYIGDKRQSLLTRLANGLRKAYAAFKKELR